MFPFSVEPYIPKHYTYFEATNIGKIRLHSVDCDGYHDKESVTVVVSIVHLPDRSVDGGIFYLACYDSTPKMLNASGELDPSRAQCPVGVDKVQYC